MVAQGEVAIWGFAELALISRKRGRGRVRLVIFAGPSLIAAASDGRGVPAVGATLVGGKGLLGRWCE